MRTSRKYKYKRGSLVLIQNWNGNFVICKVISSERKAKYTKGNEVTIVRLFNTNVNKIEDININSLTKAISIDSYFLVKRLQEFNSISKEDINKILIFSS